jgi:hypothetical protein
MMRGDRAVGLLEVITILPKFHKPYLDGLLTKLKSQGDLLSQLSMVNLRERISIPEVRVEWREIGENLMLTFLSILLYLSMVLTEFAFVPFMIIVIKKGWRDGFIYLGIGTAVALYLMANHIGHFPLDGTLPLFSPISYAFSFIESSVGLDGWRFLDFFFIFGCFGILLGYFVSRNYRLNYVVLFGIAVYAVIAVLPLIVSGLIGGFNQFIAQYSQFVSHKTNSYVNTYLTHMSSYSSMLATGGIEYSVMARKVQLAADMYKNDIVFGVAPRGGYLIKQIIVIFVSIVLVKAYFFRRHLNKAALSFSIKNYRINDGWVWGLILSWGLVYLNLHIGSPFFAIFSWNLAVIFSFLFFLRGLAIIKTLADRIRIPAILQYIMLVFLLFYSFIFFAAMVTGIGVLDIWLSIRRALEKKSERSDS